ncbi:MAG TPA: ribbon-helix-helix protein, CopG family [Terracidiphilus sp.]|jgi:RHH-type rel operon transcriptional repressor/antitoxin RelB|nr:ribbon-helix-helix protein, CopG family [Terracidiphilus sp.]
MNTYIHVGGDAVATSIRLSPELAERLDRLAAKTGRTKTFYIRRIIESGLSEMEDYYLAADTLERIRSGQEKVYTSASVRKDLGLDD